MIIHAPNVFQSIKTDNRLLEMRKDDFKLELFFATEQTVRSC